MLDTHFACKRDMNDTKIFTHWHWKRVQYWISLFEWMWRQYWRWLFGAMNQSIVYTTGLLLSRYWENFLFKIVAFSGSLNSSTNIKFFTFRHGFHRSQQEVVFPLPLYLAKILFIKPLCCLCLSANNHWFCPQCCMFARLIVLFSTSH